MEEALRWCEPHGRPDRAGEFSSDGDGDLGLGLASRQETNKAAVQAVHGLVGESHDLGGLPRATLLEAHHAGPVTVVLGGFDHQTPDVAVAGFGDLPPAFLSSRRVLAGNQAQEGHEPPGGVEAHEVV